MKVFILTEAGQKVGFGHLSRCSAVYHAFVLRGIKPHMIVNGDQGIEEFLQEIDHELFNWQESFQELLSRIAGADIVFIDSYLTEENKYHDIASIVGLLACMDDYKRIRYPQGVVINGLIYAPTMKYPQTPGIKYLLGSRYALLRKAFWKVGVKKINNQVKNIFVTFGGSDFLNLTSQTLKALTKEYPTAQKTVVISRYYKNRDQIKSAADDMTDIVFDVTESQMKTLMSHCDVAISASGQTLSELAVLGAPAVAVCVADNQRLNWKAWTQRGFVAAKPTAASIVRALASLDSQTVRKKSSLRLSKSISSGGTKAIVDALVKEFSRQRKKRKQLSRRFTIEIVKQQDCRNIWLWRNSYLTRMASFQSELIPFKMHQEWFKKKTKSSQAVLLIARMKGQDLGHVRYEIDQDQALISVLLNPQFYGLGLGSKVIFAADKKFKQMNLGINVFAEIQDHHRASINAFTMAGYKRVEGIVKNGKKAGVYQWGA